MEENKSKSQDALAKDNTKVLVIGAGGIGGTTAAFISKAGYHVEIVDNFPGLANRIEKDGIQISENGTGFNCRINAYSSISDVKEKKDIILIATKINALRNLIDPIKAILAQNGVVVSLQNGICEDCLSESFGFNRVIGCIVGWGATVIESGEIEKTSGGNFVIGCLNEQEANHFDYVKKILSTAAPVQCTDNIVGSLYSKLIINSCITTLGAISGLTLGNMLSRKKIQGSFHQYHS